jgi:hypothetical protein
MGETELAEKRKAPDNQGLFFIFHFLAFKKSGPDGTRTRDLRRDRAAF